MFPTRTAQEVDTDDGVSPTVMAAGTLSQPSTPVDPTRSRNGTCALASDAMIGAGRRTPASSPILGSGSPFIPLSDIDGVGSPGFSFIPMQNQQPRLLATEDHFSLAATSSDHHIIGGTRAPHDSDFFSGDSADGDSSNSIWSLSSRDGRNVMLPPHELARALNQQSPETFGGYSPERKKIPFHIVEALIE